MKRVLSNAEIECLGTQMINHYFRGRQYETQWVDIDLLARGCLKLDVVYATIAEDNPDKIGFLADGETPIHIRENGRIKVEYYPEKTIVLDRYLLQTNELTRRRFTLAHEVGHYILQKAKGAEKGGAFNTSPDDYSRVRFHELNDICNLEEVQANRLAAVLLMPENLVDFEMKKLLGRPVLTVFEDNLVLPNDKAAVEQIITRLQVSYPAFMNRLKELGRIEWRPGSEFVQRLFEEEKRHP